MIPSDTHTPSLCLCFALAHSHSLTHIHTITYIRTHTHTHSLSLSKHTHTHTHTHTHKTHNTQHSSRKTGVHATLSKLSSGSTTMPGWIVFLIVLAVVLALGGVVALVVIYMRRRDRSSPIYSLDNQDLQEDGLLQDHSEHLGDYGAL
jgi:hypothetical protein